MAKPLFSEQENLEFQSRVDQFDQRLNTEEGRRNWQSVYAGREQLQFARRVALVSRAQERSEEYLNALIVVVGSKGVEYVEFEDAFTSPDSHRMSELLLRYDTPEGRRDTNSLLRALMEIPKTWGMSAFIRFLRGNGKQKDAHYHGAGRFSSDYGWKAVEVEAVSRVLMGTFPESPYATVLLQLTVNEEAVDAGHFGAGVYDKDTHFIKRLCEMLERRGFAEITAPKPQKFKKERQKKVFVPGDVIQRKDLRDLPLPALVRIPAEMRRDKSDAWVSGTVDRVILEFRPALCHVMLGVDECANRSYGDTYTGKEDLDGAIFLRVWNGTLEQATLRRSEIEYRNKENKGRLFVIQPIAK